MSVYQFCMLVLVSTICGWLTHSIYLKFIFWPRIRQRFFGFSVHGFLPANQPQIATLVAGSISKHYFNETLLADKIKYDQLSLQLKPQIDGHIDAFLKDKLPHAFPMLFKLMGEKTLLKFKSVFMDEVESIMPALMKQATSNLLKKADLQQATEQAILEIPLAKVEQAFVLHAGKVLHRFKCVGALVGFMVGLLQSLVLIIFK